MTYCVGLLVEDGLVMVADTRTNGALVIEATEAAEAPLHIFF